MASANNSGISGSRPRFFSVWFNPASTGAHALSIVNIGPLDESAGTGFEILANDTSAGWGVLAHWNGAAVGGGSVTTNIWRHGVITYDDSTVYVYLDGVRVASQVVALNTTNSVVRIGGQPLYSLANYFNGQINDVRVYNRALSNDEIY